MKLFKEIIKQNAIIIQLDKTIYSKGSILKSCYKYTNENYIFIDTTSDKYIIYFQSKTKSKANINEKEFLNELLDQELRLQILKETQKIRDSIVSRALLSGQPNEDKI